MKPSLQKDHYYSCFQNINHDHILFIVGQSNRFKLYASTSADDRSSQTLVFTDEKTSREYVNDRDHYNITLGEKVAKYISIETTHNSDPRNSLVVCEVQVYRSKNFLITNMQHFVNPI